MKEWKMMQMKGRLPYCEFSTNCKFQIEWVLHMEFPYRKQTKKRLIFPGKKLTNKKKKKKVLPKVEGGPVDEKSSQQSSLPEV